MREKEEEKTKYHKNLSRVISSSSSSSSSSPAFLLLTSCPSDRTSKRCMTARVTLLSSTSRIFNDRCCELDLCCSMGGEILFSRLYDVIMSHFDRIEATSYYYRFFHREG